MAHRLFHIHHLNLIKVHPVPCLITRELATILLRHQSQLYPKLSSGLYPGCIQMPISLTENDAKFGYNQNSPRAYSQPSWLWPFGKIDPPKKTDFEESNTSAIVALEEFDPVSFTYLEKLHDASTSSDVFEVMSNAGKELTEVHLGRAVCRLADIHIDEKLETSQKGLIPIVTSPVVYDSQFRDLCQTVLHQSRFMDNELFLDVLDSLNKLKIPLKSSLVYTLLAQAEQRINTLKAAELAHFARILNRFDQRDPRVNALMSGITLLTPKHINDLVITHDVLCLINIVGSQLSSLSRGKLANMLLAILASNEERSLDDIISAVIALHKMNYKLDILLDLACPVITENMNNLTAKDLHRTVCAVGGLCYPDNGFFEAAAERILERLPEWKVKWLTDISEAFSSVEIQNSLLLDSIVRRVMECDLSRLPLTDFTKLIKSLAGFSHRPPTSWKFPDFACTAANTYAADFAGTSQDDNMTILSLAHSLAKLGIFPQELLAVVGGRKFANRVMMIKDLREYNKVMAVIVKLENLLSNEASQMENAAWREGFKKLTMMHPSLAASVR